MSLVLQEWERLCQGVDKVTIPTSDLKLMIAEIRGLREKNDSFTRSIQGSKSKDEETTLEELEKKIDLNDDQLSRRISDLAERVNELEKKTESLELYSRVGASQVVAGM